MTTLVGEGFGEKPVAGMAAHLSVATGRPALDPETLMKIVRRRMAGEEPLLLVLVCADAALALLTPLPMGATLVGVLSEGGAQPGEGLAVISAAGAVEAVAEGTYLILDPLRGKALIDPSAAEIARLAWDRRPRVLLGDANAPATTLSGVNVRVWAAVDSLEAARTAIVGGADGLLVEGVTDDAALGELAHAIGGGELAVIGDFASLEPTDWVRLAGDCTLRLCLPPDVWNPESLRDALDDAHDALDDDGERVGLPRLCALIDDAAPSGPLTGWDDVLSCGGWLPADLLAVPPLIVRVNSQDDLADTVAAGAIAVIVAPEGVGSAKKTICQLA